MTLSGIHRVPKLLGAGAGFRSLDADSYQLDTVLTHGGLLTLRGGRMRLARWSLTVLPDQPPTIAFAGLPGPEPGSANLRLGWRAGDDYGVVSAQMTAHLLPRPAEAALALPLALPDGPAPAIDAVQVADLTANPWAGLPVTMQLSDRDASGRQGSSPLVTLILPERRFTDRQARALIAIRKGLVLMPETRNPIARAAAAQAIFAAGAGGGGGGQAGGGRAAVDGRWLAPGRRARTLGRAGGHRSALAGGVAFRAGRCRRYGAGPRKGERRAEERAAVAVDDARRFGAPDRGGAGRRAATPLHADADGPAPGGG